MAKTKKTAKPKDEEHVLLRWNRSDTQQMRVVVSFYKGHEYVHIRNYWRQTAEDEWKPGKGISLWKTEMAYLFRAAHKLAKRYEKDEEVQEAIEREVADRAEAFAAKNAAGVEALAAKAAKRGKRVKAGK